MLEKIKKFLLYIGNDQNSYKLATPQIRHVNRVTTALVSTCATILIVAMFFITFFVEGVASNRSVYAIGGAISAFIMAYSLSYAKEHEWIVMPLVHISYFVFYSYGILIGTITDPGEKTVTFIVMLVFLPILFVDRPIYSIATTGIYIAIFIYLCFKNKSGAVLQNDVIDAIVFGFLGLISGMLINQIRVHSYILECKLQEVSRFDQLTQMNNRNSYELDLGEIPERAIRTLTCIYIDVNGLHELNNNKGHASGDEMLRFIAGQIKMFFGEELSFRVGGDEFIVFVPDVNEPDIKRDVNEMIANIENEGYHIAVGIEQASTHYLSIDIDSLVKTAEANMYKSKKEYYKNRTRR